MNKKAPARPVQVLLGLLSHSVNQNVTGVACTARYRGLALRVGTEQPYPAPEFFRCIDSQAFQRCALCTVFKHGAEQVAVVGGFGQVKLGNKAGNEPLEQQSARRQALRNFERMSGARDGFIVNKG